MQQELLTQRIDDLLDLIQNACEFYLLHPTRNARAVFILTDDLCELVIKSELEEAAKKRQDSFKALIYSGEFLNGPAHKTSLNQFLRREIQETQLRHDLGADKNNARKNELTNYLSQCGGDPRDWTADKDGEGFKGFEEISDEIKALRPSEANTHQILDRIVGRRVLRNKLFHDQRQSGLTVNEEKCLNALLDLFHLAEVFWGQEFRKAVNAKTIVWAQLATLRFKMKSNRHKFLDDVYTKVVNNRRKPVLIKSAHGYDCHVLTYNPSAFYNGLKGLCEENLDKSSNQLERLQHKAIPPQNFVSRRQDIQESIDIYTEVLRDCFGV